MNSRSRVWNYLFVLAWLLVLALDLIPGRLAHIDEVFFKSAGLHWARTGHFAAPEIVGRVDASPGLDEVYFAQPPVYSFVFGLYTKAFGFGPHRCILFDALIHILLAVLTVALACKLFQLPTPYAYGAGAVALLSGTQGRPDELGMCFAILGMLAWTLNVAPKFRAVLCGVAFGLCLATSLGACLFLAPLALLVAHHVRVLTLRSLCWAVVSGVVVALLCVAPILAYHPYAYRQLTAHAADQSAQMGMLLSNEVSPGAPALKARGETGFLKTFVHSEVNGVVFALHFGREIVTVIVGSLLLIALCFRAMPASEARVWKQSAVVAICAIVLIWIMLPGKYTYLWFFGPWLLSVAAIVLARSFPNLSLAGRAVVAAVLTCSTCLVVGLYARDRIIMLALPREQAFYENMERVRARIPAGARVVTGEYWWALGDKCRVLDPNFSHPKLVDFDYVVKTGNGSGVPGKPIIFSQDVENYLRDQHFVVVEDDLNRSPLTFHGIRITNSAWGFGPYILMRDASVNTAPQSLANAQH